MNAWWQFLNIGGLSCDIIGACILFWYGVLPIDTAIEMAKIKFLTGPQHETRGMTRAQRDTMKEERIKGGERYKRRAKIGLSFIIAGFSLQLLSNLLQLLE